MDYNWVGLEVEVPVVGLLEEEDDTAAAAAVSANDCSVSHSHS